METENTPKQTEFKQSPLFAPDGSPSPELKAAMKKIEEDAAAKKKAADDEWIRRRNEEAQENLEERWKNHAP